MPAASRGLELEDGSAVTLPRRSSITTGTFLNGLVHIGESSGRPAAPASRRRAISPSRSRAFGFEWGRLKTGTPPRLDRRSIDFSRFVAERGDDPPVPFSFLTDAIDRPQIACHLLHTTERVHDLVRANIDQSPLFNGQITGIGPRYCPSLEDKVMRFPHRERHQIFLEPEGLDVDEIYVNGFSMSLPRDVQDGARSRAAGPRGRGDAAARLRGRVRLHPADRAAPTLETHRVPRSVPRRPDQRHVRLRGGGGAGAVAGINAARSVAAACRRSCSAATRPTSASSSTI